MSVERKDGKPVVEPSPEPTRAPGFDELNYRIRQQELLAQLGVMALQGGSLDGLLNAAVRMTAEGLQAPYSKILKLLPDQSGLSAVAGVGWEKDIFGVVFGADTASPAGYALATGKPVISNRLGLESRFRTPKLMKEHGVRRAVNVILQGEGAPFGVLEVDSRDPGEFSERDVSFLQGAANLLGMAIERKRHEEQLEGLLEHQQALLREVNHRVKNSLQLVASMLRLQLASVNDKVARRLLGDAKARVMAIARAHERLYKTTDFTHLDVSDFLREVCADLGDGSLHVEGLDGIRIETDRAIPLALVVTELVTNSIKYAYPDGDRGPVWVRVAPVSADCLEVSVGDEGVGLPDGFDPEETPSFGMRLIRAFAQRLDATLEFRNRHPGTEAVLRLPLVGSNSKMG